MRIKRTASGWSAQRGDVHSKCGAHALMGGSFLDLVVFILVPRAIASWWMRRPRELT